MCCGAQNPNGKRQVLSYTSQGQLRQINAQNAEGSAGAAVAFYGYRGDGKRAWKQSASGGVRTYFYYAGDTLIGSESDATGSTSAVYLWGADGLIGSQSRDAQGVVNSSYNLYDAQGNLAQVTNGAGVVTPAASYTAWGEAVPRADGTLPGGGGYGAKYGYLFDGESGFYLCTYRHYDPSAGRWITRDPIGYAGGSNLYRYARNNPANLTDPNGRFPVLIVAGIIIAGWLLSDASTVDPISSQPGYRSPQPGSTGIDSVWVQGELQKMRQQDTGLMAAAKNHTDPKVFDYKMSLDPSERISLNGRWVNPGEFGNYAVGYGNICAGGGSTAESATGAFTVLLGGHFDQATEGIMQFFGGRNRDDGYYGLLDPPQDQAWIAEGSRDALRDLSKINGRK